MHDQSRASSSEADDRPSLQPPRRFFGSTPFLAAVFSVGVALVACALGWRWLEIIGGDAGPIEEWAGQLKEVYRPLAQGASVLSAGGEVMASGWKGLWSGLNGHWDARLLSSASVVVFAIGFGWVVASVLRVVRQPWEYATLIAIALATLLHPSAGEFFASESCGWWGWLLLFSVVQLKCHFSPGTTGTQLWLGTIAGLLNVVSSVEGGGVAIALAIVSGTRLASAQSRGRGDVRVFGVNALLAVASAVSAARFGNLFSIAGWGDALAGVYCWPPGSPWTWLILSLPAVAWMTGESRRVEGDNTRTLLTSLAACSLVMPAWIALAGNHGGVAVWGVLSMVALINGACLLGQAANVSSSRRVNATWMTVWALAAAHMFIQIEPDLEKQHVERGRKTQWLKAWHENDAHGLAQALRLTEREAGEILALKGDLRIQSVVSPTFRGSAPVVQENTASGNFFRAGGVPALRGETAGLQVWGTWGSEKRSGAAEFAGGPVRISGPVIRIWVSGECRPGAFSIFLRTEDGRIISPLTMPSPEADRWGRLNFRNPGAPFKVIARLDTSDGWAAISGPVSVGLLSWVVPKLTVQWGWLLGSGVILSLVSGVFWIRRSSPLRAEQPGALREKDARFLPWLALAAYAVIVSQGVNNAAGGSDSSGYLNNARMMLEGKLSVVPRPVAGASVAEFGGEIFSPMPFKAAAVAGEIAPITAPGLPLMCAALGCVLPLYTAVSVVIFVNLLLGILFTRLLAAEFGLSWKWAWLAGFGIGLSPLYLFIGLQPLSDGPSLTWVTGAIYFAWVSRRKPRYAWLAGGATAIAVLLRPPNFLCMVPILICLSGSWRRYVRWAAGGVPGAVFQLWYSWRVWGNPFTSGYDKVGDVVKLSYLPANAAHFALWLPWLLTPVVVFAFALPWIRRPAGLVRVVLGAWIGVFLGFYGVFAFTHEAWWFLRFILPAFPGLMIASLLGAREAGERFTVARFLGGPRRSRELLAIGMLGLLLFSVHERRVFFWLGRDRNLIKAAEWLKEHAAPGSSVLSVQGAGTVFYYTDLPVILYYHDVVRESPAFARALDAGGKDVYAFMFHFERPDARPDFLGVWDEMAAFQEDGVKIWKRRRPEAPGR